MFSAFDITTFFAVKCVKFSRYANVIALALTHWKQKLRTKTHTIL